MQGDAVLFLILLYFIGMATGVCGYTGRVEDRGCHHSVAHFQGGQARCILVMLSKSSNHSVALHNSSCHAGFGN